MPRGSEFIRDRPVQPVHLYRLNCFSRMNPLPRVDCAHPLIEPSPAWHQDKNGKTSASNSSGISSAR
jgi:hypothetical protein